MKKFIQRERLYQLFREMVRIDSVSFQERKSADYVIHFLQKLGAEVYEDEAWKRYFTVTADASGRKTAKSLHGGETAFHAGMFAGNVYAYIPGELPGKPLLFSAHLDTVSPGIGKKAVMDKDNTIRSEGNTVLGADNFAGVVQILEAVRLLKENEIKHKSLELLFPIAEELYSQGCRVFDYGQLKASEAYVLDLCGSVGLAALQAPSIISFKIEIKGHPAHAGFAPEDGIHAIQAAAEAVSKLKMGRIGDDSTRNIGLVYGGTARNIVPDLVSLEGEIRSYFHLKGLSLLEEIGQVFQETAEKYGAQAVIDLEVEIKAYQTKEDAPVVKRFQKACGDLGIDVGLQSTFGGSDNNNFAEHGIQGIVLSYGMQQVHTKEEYIQLEDLCMGTELVMKLMTEIY